MTANLPSTRRAKQMFLADKNFGLIKGSAVFGCVLQYWRNILKE